MTAAQLTRRLPRYVIVHGRRLHRSLVTPGETDLNVFYACPDFFDCPSGRTGLYFSVTVPTTLPVHQLGAVVDVKIQDGLSLVEQCIRDEVAKGCRLKQGTR